MAPKSDNPKSVCFSAVLRRLLCSGGSPTHPSDNISESESSKIFLERTKTEEATPGRESPNLVARLMGLDSLPEKNWVWNETPPRSVTRSKSVNFMEYLLKHEANDEEEEEGTLFRPVKASVSFREFSYSARNQRKHEFLMMYLDKLDEKCEFGLKSKVSEKVFKELVQKKGEKNKNRDSNKKEKEVKRCNNRVLRLKDEPRKVCKNKKVEIGGNKVSRFDVNLDKSSAKSPVITAKNRRKRINPKVEEEPESSSEGSNPSPISVLEFDLPNYQTHCDDYSSSPGDSVSRRLDSETESTEYTTNLMGVLANLSEKDVKETSWYSKEGLRFEDLEELCEDLAEEVVDQVLDQLVDELCL